MNAPGRPKRSSLSAQHEGTPVNTAVAAYQQYLCRVCGLVYDEALGDPDSGLAPGTRFADIPEDWGCPICGVGKADFELMGPVADAARRTAVRSAAAPRAGAGAGRGDAGVVIVGAGRAGWAVAAALRAADARLPITMVAACSADVYDKPQLSVAVARGLDPGALVREAAADAAARLGVRLLPHTHAVDVCLPSRRLRTTRGSLRWRQLVLAHGATPALPAVLPADRVWRCNDLAAYQRLRAALDGAARPQRVVIVGAGLVGCELANDLALAGHRITLLDVQDRPLAALLPPEASAALLSAWGHLPLQFVGPVQVTGVSAGEGAAPWAVAVQGGARVEADHVIAATGLRAPARLAHRAGLAFDTRAGGVVARATDLRTSAADVYALGDCVAVDGQASRFIAPIAGQARAIAAAILGQTPAAPAGAAPTAAPPLRVKTSSWPITLEGLAPPGAVWRADGPASPDPAAAQRWVCLDASGRLLARVQGGAMAAAMPRG